MGSGSFNEDTPVSQMMQNLSTVTGQLIRERAAHEETRLQLRQAQHRADTAEDQYEAAQAKFEKMRNLAADYAHDAHERFSLHEIEAAWTRIAKPGPLQYVDSALVTLRQLREELETIR